MIPVYLCSPWRGDTIANLKYAMDCMRDSLSRGESPFASHLLYTQVLDDWKEEERKLGMDASYEWLVLASKCVVYTKLGTSEGMRAEIELAEKIGVPIEYRDGLANDKV